MQAFKSFLLLTALLAASDARAANPDKELIKAAQKLDVERARRALDAGADPAKLGKENFSPLLHAFLANRKRGGGEGADFLGLVELLLSRGAPALASTIPNMPTPPAENTSSIAAEAGWTKTLLLMLDATKDDAVAAQIWGDAYFIAHLNSVSGEKGAKEMREALVARCEEDYRPARCPLVLAAVVKSGDIKRVERLLDKGADPNGRSRSGGSVLSEAVAHDLPLVELLVSRGAHLNDEYHSPLAWAACHGNREVVDFLLAKGAELELAIKSTRLVGGCKNPDPKTLLEKILADRSKPAAEPSPQAAAAPPGVSKQELAEMLKAAVEASKSAPAAATAPTYRSEVDFPAHRRPERPSDLAVIVGIERYSDLPDARFAERDAEAFKNHMLALGLPSRNIVLLLGDKAGYKSVEKFVETWLPRNAGPESRVFFYFSGHGAPDPASGAAYLLPWDGDPSFLENTGYPVKRLYAKLGALKAKEVVVALDACFSGAGGRSVLAKGARPLVTKVQADSIGEKLTLFAAASSDQITSTREDQGHGTFTYHFLRGLAGGAKDAAGAVTVKRLSDYLKPKVEDDARRQNREQSPVTRGVRPDLVLVRFD